MTWDLDPPAATTAAEGVSAPMDSGCQPQAHGRAMPAGKTPCPLCGRPRCTGTVRHSTGGGSQKGERCRRNPVPGGWGCLKHGSAHEGARAAGRRRKAEERLSRELFDRDAPPVRDVTASALRLAGKLESMVDELGDRLNGDSLSQEDRAFFTATVGQLAPLLTRLGALRLGERQVELDAERLQLVRVALARGIAAAELGVEQRATFLRVFAAEVRARGLLEIEGSE